jgi:two-component system, cell cycle sensor histidine kinase and response regulator CckA
MGTEKARILIVEDEHIVALDIKMLLIKYGYDVMGIHSSAEPALAAIEKDIPDLVLMDIKLQGEMDGIEATELIKDRFDIPVILLTAFADEATLQRAKLTEPFAYLIKPFEDRELRTQIVIALYRHKMEKEIKTREKLFSTTLNSIGDAVILLDQKDRVQYCNPVAAIMANGNHSNDKELTFFELFHFEGNPFPHGFREMREKTISADIVSEKQKIQVEVRVSPIIDPSEVRTGTVIVMTDITERIRAQQTLKEREEQLRQSQKMEAIGRLSGGIAHDFNNLLTVIMGYSKLMKENISQNEVPEREEIANDIEGIQNAALKSANLTRQLLTFSRHQMLRLRIHSLNDIVKDMQKMLRRLITEEIDIKLSLQADFDKVYIDQVQMEQVIINLAVNARDAMPEGGTLKISTSNIILEDTIQSISGAIKPGDYVIISVEDTGEGITKENMNRIFEPFFTTKDRGQGTGLGLSTVYGIIKQIDGSISVSSAPKKGTNFKIYIPATQKVDESRLSSPYSEGDGKGTETILLVEDDENLKFLLSRILRRKGYNVLESQNAGEALLICEDYKGQIHLLVSDIVMPHLSGDKLAKRLQSIRPDLKILLISGYPDRYKTENDEGIFTFIQKPFELDSFTRIIRQVLDSSEPLGTAEENYNPF